METLVVSREVHLDLSKPGAVEKVKLWQQIGWSVCRKDGSEVLANRRSQPVSRNDITEAISAIRNRHGLSFAGIGALVGVSDATAVNWSNGKCGISPEAWRRVLALRKKSDSLPPKSDVLIAEARGAVTARRLVKRGRPDNVECVAVTEDKKLEIAILRCDEGLSFAEIAKRIGVSSATVHRVCREFSLEKKEA